MVHISCQNIQLNKMIASVENIELLLNEAHLNKGWSWVITEPLWCTWPMEKFCEFYYPFPFEAYFINFIDKEILHFLPILAQSLEEKKSLLDVVRSHDASFEKSRECLQNWSNVDLAHWEELDGLFSVEIEGWLSRKGY